MPISPADFYAYSRATGTEYPEDPQSRAALAPEVAEWRRNQLKAPREESDAIDTAGKVGLGALIAAGAYGLSRGGRFGRLRESIAGAVRPKDRGATGGVTQVKLAREAAPAVEKVVKQDPDVIKRATQDLNRLAESIEAPAATVAPSTGQASTLFQYERRSLPYPGARERAREQFARSLEAPPATFTESNTISRLREDVSEQIQAQESPGFAEQYLGQKGYVDAPGGQQATLVETQEVINQPKVSAQSVDAAASASDQLDAIAESEIQRDVDSVRYGKQAVAAEQVESDFQRFSRRAEEIGADAKYRAALNAAMEEDWSGGLPDDLIDDVGAAMQQARYQRQYTAFDLRGTPESLPGYSEMRFKQRKGVIEPSRQALGPSQQPLVEGGRRIGMTEEEIVSRIEASASFPRGSAEEQMLLNPDVPTTEVRGLMGSTPLIRGGRVGTNPTFEVTPGARASMTEVDEGMREWAGSAGTIESVEDELLERARQRKEAVIDTNIDDYEAIQSTFENADVATDYGEVTGPGGLVDTLSYRERTNKGSTLIPGQVQGAEGVSAGSFRQEREIDAQLPVRRTEEGDVSPGRFVDPETGRITLEGAAERVGERLRGRLESSDINLMSESGKMDTRAVGGFEPLGPGMPQKISQQPVSEKVQPGTNVKIVDGQPYILSSKTKVTGQRPLMGKIGRKILDAKGQTSFLFNPKELSYDLTRMPGMTKGGIDSDLLVQMAKDAQFDYFNNPTAKRQFLSQTNPQLLEEVGVTKTLSEVGGPLEKGAFIANEMNKQLQSKYGISLDVLQPKKGRRGSTYTGGDTFAFIDTLLKPTKESQLYGTPAVEVSPGKFKAIKNKEEGPIPGAYITRGFGGVDPMEVGDDYEGSVAYLTPRIQTAPQVIRFRNRETGEIGDILTASTSAMGPQGQLSTGEVVPQSKLYSRYQFRLEPQTRQVTRTLPGGGTYEETVYPEPIVKERELIETPSGKIREKLTFEQGEPAFKTTELSSQRTSPTYGSAGVQLTNLRNLMETAPQGLPTPYTSNVGGGLIANTKRPYSGLASFAYGGRLGPLPRGDYKGTALPMNRFGYINPNERGVGASRVVNLSATSPQQELNLSEFTRTAEQTPGGRVVPGAVNLGGGMGIIEGGIGPYTESETISRYGVSGKEVKRLGDQLMYQAALRRNR